MMNMLTLHRATPSSNGSMQIYFEHIKISDIELRVSMLTTSQLPPDLLKIKRHLGFPLVKFESPISLDGFHQAHTLGNTGLYVDSLAKHYKGVRCVYVCVCVFAHIQPFGLLLYANIDYLFNFSRQVVKSQSIKVLGSVDFLGNPVGLLSDVASGVTGLIAAQPDVLGLVRDVTHGMSDTTSKVSGYGIHKPVLINYVGH